MLAEIVILAKKKSLGLKIDFMTHFTDSEK
jgi:hypothetical protein